MHAHAFREEALGKLRTTRQPARAVAEGGLVDLPVSFEHAEAVGGLPPHDNDPFDRLLVAAARVEGLTIVTNDAKFELYEVPLIDARR